MEFKAKAQSGLAMIKDAIVETLRGETNGMTNAELADALGLRSDFQGENKDYLSWSVLGLLVNSGQVRKDGKRYYLS